MAVKKGEAPKVPPVDNPEDYGFDEDVFREEMKAVVEKAVSDNREETGGDSPAEPPAPQEGNKPVEGGKPVLRLDEIIVPEDAEVSKFFVGKPVTEVFKSHHHAEVRLQQLAEENTRLKTQIVAATQVKDVLRELGKEAKEPQEVKPNDPLAGLNLKVDPLKDPEGFYRKMYERMVKQAEVVAEEKFNSYIQREQAKNEGQATYNKAMNSIESARAKLAEYRPEFADPKKFDRVGKSLINEIVSSSTDYPGGLESEQSYILAYSNLYGPVDQAKSVPSMETIPHRAASVTTPSGSPSSARAAAGPARGSSAVPTLSNEEAEAANKIASMIILGGIGELPEDRKNEILAEVRDRTARAMMEN